MRTLVIALALVAWLGSSAARAQDKPAAASPERGKQDVADMHGYLLSLTPAPPAANNLWLLN